MELPHWQGLSAATMRRVGELYVSKNIEVHFPNPVGLFVFWFVVGRAEVAIGLWHATTVPPC